MKESNPNFAISFGHKFIWKAVIIVLTPFFTVLILEISSSLLYFCFPTPIPHNNRYSVKNVTQGTIRKICQTFGAFGANE